MFTQENIGCHKTRFCDGLALNKSQNCKKALTNQSLLKKRSFFKVKSFVKAFKQDVVCDDDIKRFAFYHAGNCLVQTLLLRHPKTSLFFTEPKIDQNAVLVDDVVVGVRSANKSEANMTISSSPRSEQRYVRDLISNSEKLLSIETRISLEILLIGFYAGKVGEFFDNYTTRNTVLKKHSFLTTTQRNTLFGVIGNKNSKQSVASALPFDVVVGVRSVRFALQNEVLHNTRYKNDVFVNNSSCKTNMTKSLHIHAKIDQFLYQSDIGLSERIRATSLVKHILVNGSIYSGNFFNLQKNSILGNLNKTEILERKIFALFQNLEREIDTVYSRQLQKQSYSRSSRVNFVLQEQGKQSQALSTGNNGALATTNFFSSKKIDIISQNRETSAWCEEMVCKALTFYRKPYGHWFRIYLPQIETHQRQPASLDKFFTKSREFLLSETPSIANSSYSRRLQSFAYNSNNIVTQTLGHLWPQEFSHGTHHNLVLNTFCRTFNLIGKNRELFDILADHFIRFGKIRMPEILRICRLYVEMSNLQGQNHIFSEEIEKNKAIKTSTLV